MANKNLLRVETITNWLLSATKIEKSSHSHPVFLYSWPVVSLSYTFRFGRSTVSRIIRETCEALRDKLYPIVLAKSSSEKWLAFANKLCPIQEVSTIIIREALALFCQPVWMLTISLCSLILGWKAIIVTVVSLDTVIG
ncbi:hypothetical protein CEXT_627111 [Caerostris extrusa]|uniref:Uncharacterized protein n=1 Tax=Caerostris extrusa TaxID=172846 RepID=A0AAV4WYM7_CAEEX|nr:hypothetical protein CEXT_627111 [Caerostris extrusa]